MAEYDIDGVSPDMSFLEMLDMLNEQLTDANQEPVAFDHDCREGICGMCGLVMNVREFASGDLVSVARALACARVADEILVRDVGDL